MSDPNDRPDPDDQPDPDDRSDLDDQPDPDDRLDPEIDDLPTVTCSRCDREWDLGHELDELQVGNQALEQFALDHERHTGHFPDGVETFRADCRECPEVVQRLSEDAARRWAETHARHTRHSVDVRGAVDGSERVEPSG